MNYKTYNILSNIILLIIFNIYALYFIMDFDLETFKLNTDIYAILIVVYILFLVINIIIRKTIYKNDINSAFNLDLTPFIARDERESEIIGTILSKSIFTYFGIYTVIISIAVLSIYTLLLNYYGVLNNHTFVPFGVAIILVIFDLNVIMISIINLVFKNKLKTKRGRL